MSAVARLNGHTWRAVTVPDSTYTQLTAVSCPTRSECEAASMTDDQGRSLAIRVITPTSTRLASRLIPPASGSVVGLSGISCTSTNHCAVAGGDEGAAGAFAITGTW
jgi:hypothetical protein